MCFMHARKNEGNVRCKWAHKPFKHLKLDSHWIYEKSQHSSPLEELLHISSFLTPLPELSVLLYQSPCIPESGLWPDT